MQQHLMQMQPMMAAYYPNNVTTDQIQQYLDENKSLILKIVESQNSGKLGECADMLNAAHKMTESGHTVPPSYRGGIWPGLIVIRNQARLQRNLMYLAAIADSQPQPPTMHVPPSGIMQPGSHYLQHQQAQQMTPQSVMAARSSALYSQQQFLALQQQQALQSQLGMSSGGSSGLHMMQQSEGNSSGSTGGALGAGGGFPVFGLVTGGGGPKQEMGSGEGRGGSTGGHGSEGSDYLKAGEDGN